MKLTPSTSREFNPPLYELRFERGQRVRRCQDPGGQLPLGTLATVTDPGKPGVSRIVEVRLADGSERRDPVMHWEKASSEQKAGSRPAPHVEGEQRDPQEAVAPAQRQTDEGLPRGGVKT